MPVSTDTGGMSMRMRAIMEEYREYVRRKLAKGEHFGAVLVYSMDKHGHIEHYDISENLLTIWYQSLALYPFLIQGPAPSQFGVGAQVYLNALIGTGTTAPTMGDKNLTMPYAIMSLAQLLLPDAIMGYNGGAGFMWNNTYNGVTLRYTPPATTAATYTLATLELSVIWSGVFPNSVTISEAGLMLTNTGYTTPTVLSGGSVMGILLEHDLFGSAISVSANGSLGMMWSLGV